MNNNDNTNVPVNKEMHHSNTDSNPILKKEFSKLKAKVTKIAESVQVLVGMVGTKFKIDSIDKMHYQPWDCTTSKDSSVDKWSKNEILAQKVVSYTKSSFFKTYPLNFSSGNADCTKTWLIGGQIAAINMQSTKDDFTLINQIFFSLGNNFGYRLKSNNLIEGNYVVNTKPVLNVSINFILGTMLHSLSDKIIKEMSITVELVGSYEDDKNNKKFTFKTISEHFINPVFENEKVEFNVYNSEISFILVKISSSGEMIGRGFIPVCALMSGIRTICLYNNECKLVTDAKLLSIVSQKSL